MTNKYYEKDFTDIPLVQLIVGTALGYLFGLGTQGEGDASACALCAGGLCAYRCAHQLGFLEMNLLRHVRRDARRRTRRTPEREAGLLAFFRDLADNNKFLVGGLVGGYAFARCQRMGEQGAATDDDVGAAAAAAATTGETGADPKSAS